MPAVSPSPKVKKLASSAGCRARPYSKATPQKFFLSRVWARFSFPSSAETARTRGLKNRINRIGTKNLKNAAVLRLRKKRKAFLPPGLSLGKKQGEGHATIRRPASQRQSPRPLSRRGRFRLRPQKFDQDDRALRRRSRRRGW